ncbi:MAG: hypothetical protein EPN91_12795 [Salinibacterium sp.]|nr:MAG: hypothetical protein EPN91_12795 [Salinibacterium sp.]
MRVVTPWGDYAFVPTSLCNCSSDRKLIGKHDPDFVFASTTDERAAVELCLKLQTAWRLYYSVHFLDRHLVFAWPAP